MLADRAVTRSDRTFWLNRVEDITRVVDVINQTALDEAARSPSPQRHQDIFFQNSREAGVILMNRLSAELGMPLP